MLDVMKSTKSRNKKISHTEEYILEYVTRFSLLCHIIGQLNEEISEVSDISCTLEARPVNIRGMNYIRRPLHSVAAQNTGHV